MRNQSVRKLRGRSRTRLEEPLPVETYRVDLRVLKEALQRVDGDRSKIRIRKDGTIAIYPNGAP